MEASVPLAPDTGSSAPRRGPLARLAGSPLFWVGFVVLGLTVSLLNAFRRPSAPPLPDLGALPAFQLTADDGQPYGSAELRGHVWMAGFIFTRCPTICPALTATMAKIQHRARGLEPAFRMVSFSVDPQYDTPARLDAFARAHRASPRLWKFVTGPLDALKATVEGGLKISMGAGAPQGEQDFASIFHGTHFVLVDGLGHIRGYYDSSNPDVVDKVLHDAAMLINRGR